MVQADFITVRVVYSPAPRQLLETALTLPQGAQVRQALDVLALDPCFADRSEEGGYGIWNKKVRTSHVLQDHDRLEIYRPLRVDPKVARCERFKKQGAKSAGLFAKRRPGAKAGY